MSFSLCISHTPWVPARDAALKDMQFNLLIGAPASPGEHLKVPVLLNDTDYRETDWQVSKVKWALDQWRWSAAQPTTHHIFMTDDLHIAPRFWTILDRMVAYVPDKPIGLLSNSPRGPALAASGVRGYFTNSWIVGPAYVLPHDLLVKFLAYFEALTFEQQKYANDDSSINAWVTEHGPGETWHPLPTVIEHRADLESTVGHGDKYSRERVSWREMRTWTGDAWSSWTCAWDIDAMCTSEFWATDFPHVPVGE